MKDTVFSGMRPTGLLHLGHYFGALENWIKMQDEYRCFFSIVDWHAMTTNFEHPENIKENSRQMLIDWLSTGLDINKSTIFVQSHNLAHAELFLLLGMLTPVSWLERCPSYKEQQQEIKDKDLSNFGFLGYPVLMAVDILLYNTKFVPVGVDQIPHIEIAREIARRFHALYNVNIFTEPEARLTKVQKLPGLDGRKMSKSYNNSIALNESDDSIDKKIRPMITDVNRVKRSDPGNPDICPVFDYQKVFSSASEQAEIIEGCKNAGIGCIDCKKILIKNIQTFLAPIRERRAFFEKEVTDVTEYLSDSQKRANTIAEETLVKVRAALKI